MNIPVFAPAFDINQVGEINAKLSSETKFNIGENCLMVIRIKRK